MRWLNPFRVLCVLGWHRRDREVVDVTCLSDQLRSRYVRLHGCARCGRGWRETLGG
jgi:hypothetical protein